VPQVDIDPQRIAMAELEINGRRKALRDPLALGSARTGGLASRIGKAKALPGAKQKRLHRGDTDGPHCGGDLGVTHLMPFAQRQSQPLLGRQSEGGSPNAEACRVQLRRRGWPPQNILIGQIVKGGLVALRGSALTGPATQLVNAQVRSDAAQPSASSGLLA
jgi:hypothetical protein